MKRHNLRTLLEVTKSLEEQGKIGEDTSLRIRRLLKKLGRAIAHQDHETARRYVTEICLIYTDLVER